MKKLLYTLLAVSIIFSACDKDQESNSNSNIDITVSNMTGVWRATSFILDDNNLANFATIKYWLKPNMIIEENIENNNNPDNIDVNIGEWEINGSNLIIQWVTGERTTYEITPINNTTVSLLLVEWFDNGEIESITILANFVKE
tara:strand:- start:65 stop:496 length:432 start_codon:yes stop_codon:yes gene_type:complete